MPELRERKPFARTLGVRVRQRRHSLTASAINVAAEARITRAALNNIEAGRRTPSVDVLIRLAGALGTTPDGLLGPLVRQGQRKREKA